MDLRRNVKSVRNPGHQAAPPPVPQTPAPAVFHQPSYQPVTPAPVAVPDPAPSVAAQSAAPASFPEPTIHHAPAAPFPEVTQAPISAPHAQSGKRLYAVHASPAPGAIVIHCSDPRFQSAFEQFVEHEIGLAKGDYIPIVVGGGAGVLGHPEQLPKEFKFLKERLEHYRQIFPTARRIILINHEGCRYYQNLKSRALALIGSRLHLPLDLGRGDLSLVAESFRHFLSHLGYSIELYYAKFADPEHTHIEIEKVGP